MKPTTAHYDEAMRIMKHDGVHILAQLIADADELRREKFRVSCDENHGFPQLDPLGVLALDILTCGGYSAGHKPDLASAKSK